MIVTIPCICPGQPHDQDTVTLADTLGFRAAKTVRYRAMLLEPEERADMATVLAVLTEAYLELGVTAWSLVDEKGKPVEVTRQAIQERLLTHQDEAEVVSDAADDLYAEAVMRPLLNLGSTSLPAGQTEPSTSPRTGSEPTPLRPSKPSSTSTTRTDGIAATS